MTYLEVVKTAKKKDKSMIIPYEDNLEIGYLSRIFDRNRISNCYKFFWFKAILELMSKEKTVLSYDELITEMITDAWYMVIEYKLRLGPCNTVDNLEEVVKYLYSDLYEERIRSTEGKEKLRTLLKNESDRRFIDYKNKLTNNVPYCLQSVFYPFIKDPNKNKIDLFNQEERLLYYFSEFNKLQTTIRINEEWIDYLLRNKEILIAWTRYNLINYLQDRNPSVPGIADKILPPTERKLTRVTRYWNAIIEVDPSLTDIYEKELLKDVSISIDHFVPWQYVAHDELWNLSPTSRSINSKKSNNLPNWDTYFYELALIEYKAYQLSFSNSLVAKEFKLCADYHLNNPEIRNALYSSGLNEEVFKERLYNVIRPVYESAKNCGFREWC